MRIHHIGITVRDLENSVKFYKESFGFREIRRYTKEGWDGSSIIIELGDMQIELFQFKNSKERKDNLSDLTVLGLKHIAIEVESVDKKYKELKSKNIDIDGPKKGTTCAKFCFLRDPDGIPIELYQRK